MNRFLENLKREAEANPILALGVAAGLITAISKFIDSSTDAKTARMNARSWDRETARRAMKDTRR